MTKQTTCLSVSRRHSHRSDEKRRRDEESGRGWQVQSPRSMPSLEIGRHEIVPGRYYRTPKEVWGFRLGPSSRPPGELAYDVLAANRDLIGLRGILGTLNRRPVRRSVGGWHVIFSQFLFGHRVHRAYVTVHMNRRRQVYLVKNRAVPHE